MTLVCSKCGSGNIVNDMEYGNRLAYKKCLMCGSVAVKEIKVKEAVEDMRPTTIIPEPGMITRLEYIRHQTGLKLAEFCKHIGISRSQWHKIKMSGPTGVAVITRIADNLHVDYMWLTSGTGVAPDKIKRIAPEPIHDAGYPLPEDKKIQAVAEEIVSDALKAKPLHPDIVEESKAVKVLEMYEYKENGRLATIGIKDGKYQYVYVEGINQHKWSLDDVMFLHKATGEVLRLVQG